MRYHSRRDLFASFALDFAKITRDHFAPHIALGEFYELFFIAAVVVQCNEHGQCCTASVIARRLQMPRSTVARRLDRCVELGLMTRGDDHQYHATYADARMRTALGNHIMRASNILTKMAN